MSALFFVTLVLAQAPTGAGDATLSVRHDHALGSCTGSLIFDDDGVRYDTANEDHARYWSYPEVRLFELVSHERIKLHSYEDRGALGLWSDQTFTFDIADPEAAELVADQAFFESADGRIGPDLYRWLLEKSPRPVLNRGVTEPSEIGVTDSTGAVLQALPVRHDHFLGGCQGTLTITEEHISYSTDHADHARIWQMADVETFASTGDFDLRISTRNDTFHFELKVPLERATYAYLWNRVYEPEIQSYRGRGQ